MRKILVAALSLALSASCFATSSSDRDFYCTGAVSTPIAIDNKTVSMTTDATPNTEGAWGQIEAAIPARADLMYIQFRATSTNGGGLALCDIGIDTAGGTSYSEIVSNLGISEESQVGIVSIRAYNAIPVAIPSGSSVAVRCQNSVASQNIQAYAQFMTRDRPTITNPVTYGAVDAASSGTNADPGGSANTKTYTQITAATTQVLRQLWIHAGGNGDTARSATLWLINATYGTAPGTAFIADIRELSGSATDVPDSQNWGPFPVYLPVGTVLNVGVESNVTTDGDRDLDVIFYGSPEPMGAPCR